MEIHKMWSEGNQTDMFVVMRTAWHLLLTPWMTYIEICVIQTPFTYCIGIYLKQMLVDGSVVKLGIYVYFSVLSINWLQGLRELRDNYFQIKERAIPTERIR